MRMTRDGLKSALRKNGIYYPSSALKSTLQAIYDKNLDPTTGVLKYYAVGEYERPEDKRTTRKYAEDEIPIDDDVNEGIDDDELNLLDPEEPSEQIIPNNDQPSSSEMDDLLGKIESAEVPPRAEKSSTEPPLFEATKSKKKKGSTSPDSFRVEGYILMLVVDTVFPFTLATINNMMDKRNKIEAHQLSLSEADFAKLSPLADQAADYLQINLNPIAGFFLTASFIYGSNLMNVRMQVATKQ